NLVLSPYLGPELAGVREQLLRVAPCLRRLAHTGEHVRQLADPGVAEQQLGAGGGAPGGPRLRHRDLGVGERRALRELTPAPPAAGNCPAAAVRASDSARAAYSTARAASASAAPSSAARASWPSSCASRTRASTA